MRHHWTRADVDYLQFAEPELPGLLPAPDQALRPVQSGVPFLQLIRDVDFRGRVNPARMNELYDEAHIYLNSSNIDNMPGSILESFASGVPVVSTSAGGIKCIVAHEQTGLLVPKNDHEAMASWAIRLLESPEMAASIARNAYEECTAYTWEAVRESWRATYSRLAGREARAGGAVVAEQLILEDK